MLEVVLISSASLVFDKQKSMRAKVYACVRI